MSAVVFILGAGSVGASIGRGLATAGITVAGVYCRDPEHAAQAARTVGAPPYSEELPPAIREVDVVLATVPDLSIARLAERAVESAVINDAQVWLHCAGGLAADALAPLRGRVRGVGTLHPALAFPRGLVTEIPAGVSFAVDGDPPALDAANELIAALGGVAVRVPPEQRVTYHAALVLASNYLVALLAEARAVLRHAGMTTQDAERLLVSLGPSALRAATDVGIDSSLTGPISRGDAESVERHLNALAGTPEAARLYRELGRATLRVARDRSDLSAEQLDALSTLLEDPDDA
ncbi:MAG: DUF2520 domain-containing protein [Deltaproteobacteria bacterium]|nr:DUF2520 domain-containing protein [Deltaproteobacteria bacterium]